MKEGSAISAGPAVAAAATFIWLGMVLAISFLEAPLKFRAPGVTLPIGLAIGRLVFRALNGAEVAFAVVIVAAVALSRPPVSVVLVAAILVVVLLVQLLGVRPRLTRRSDAVLAGHDGPRSRGHYVYVALEVLKVIALATLGILLLAG